MVSRNPPKARKTVSLTLSILMSVAAFTFLVRGASGAQVSQVSGGAFGHYTNVSLFGGPSIPKGPAPDVRLPPTGSATPLTASEPSAVAVYGPAYIFAGKWPEDVGIAPPSGPITVSTRGTTGPGGSVTSTVDIVLRSPPDPKSPGGWGPLPPNEGDELHSTCTATESGATGSVRLVNAVMSKSTDPEGGPTEIEPLPENPPVNYTREGILSNVGDRYRLVYNEQFVEPDGSLTVNAVHMYLLGDIAVGEQILGQVRCSTTGAAFPNTPPPVAAGSSSPPPTSAALTAAPTEDDLGGDWWLFVLGGIGVMAVLVTGLLLARRRRESKGEPLPE